MRFHHLLVIIGLCLLFSACATTPTPIREVTVTKEVPVPYHQPCPNAVDIPGVPKRVAEEHPVMPKDAAQADGIDWHAVSRILADKVLELFGYADKANGIMQACAKP
jgi:PBP1b-binding outer membrane lipoprotein LpoB